MSGTLGGGSKHTRGNVVAILDDDLSSSCFKDAEEERLFSKDVEGSVFIQVLTIRRVHLTGIQEVSDWQE